MSKRRRRIQAKSVEEFSAEGLEDLLQTGMLPARSIRPSGLGKLHTLDQSVTFAFAV